MVKQFRGQVKVADVQAAFDEIVNNINTLVDNYNAESYVQDIDYSVGGTSLAPSGYTLTVGGYKQFFNACEGAVAGGKPYKISDTQFKMSTGMLVARDGIYRLPDSILDIPTDTSYRTVYYNTDTKKYQWTGDGTISHTVTKTITVGSNLYNCTEGSTQYKKLNSTAYNSNILGTETIRATSNNVGYIGFMKYTPSNSTTAIQMDIDNYAYVPFDRNLAIGDSIIFDFSKTGLHYSYTTGIVPYIALGSLSADGKTFTPAYSIDTLRYGSNKSCDIIMYHLSGVEETTRGGYTGMWATPDSSMYRGNMTGSFMDNDGIWYLKVVEPEVSTTATYPRLDVIELVDGVETHRAYITFDRDITKDNINTMILSCTASPDDTVVVEASGVDVECIGVKQSGGNVYINDTSKTMTITSVVTEESDTAAYRICSINPNCTSKFIGTMQNVQCEKIDGTYKITNQTKDYRGYWVKYADIIGKGSPWYEKLDTSSKPKFVIGNPSWSDCPSKHGVSAEASAFLFGEQVVYNAPQGYRSNTGWLPSSWLFVPKGVDNPYTYYSGKPSSTAEKYSSQKVLNVKITKDIEDTSG